MPEYIDRQKAITKLRYRERTFGCTAKAYSKVIKDMPAEDVAPIIHAEWIICSDGYYPYCSNCHYEPALDVKRSKNNLTKYCANCGAKMDGGAEE